MKHFRELWHYREMIISLVKRDLKSRYKGSVLGVLWMILNPLFQLIIYTIVFSGILKSNIDRFSLFLFVALVPWIFISTCFCEGTTVILGQQEMIKKIYFPREVMPIAYTTAQFINMLLSFVVIFIFVAFYKVKITPVMLIYLVIIMLIEYIMALGITFWVSCMTVYFRDLRYIFSIISMAWMYLTPILYDVDMVSERYRKLFLINPMAPIVVAYRDILYYGRIPERRTYLIAASLGVVLLVSGRLIFSILQKHFAEEL